jgi:hypothetical protein
MNLGMLASGYLVIDLVIERGAHDLVIERGANA